MRRYNDCPGVPIEFGCLPSTRFPLFLIEVVNVEKDCDEKVE
jgi:hypothetical protein